jgi:hypothetical protein
LTALTLGAALANGQGPGSGNLFAPSSTPPDQTPGGPPTDLLSLSHAGAPPEDHADTAKEIACIEQEPEPRPTRFWARTEYLLWWIKDSNFPVLLTTGAVTDPRPGALGMPGTGLLFGGSGIDNKERNGGRVAVGYWFDDCQRFGVEAGYFFLGERSVGAFSSASGLPGSRVLARPFFNANTMQEDSSLVTFPGLVGGSVGIGSSSELHSAELNCLWNVARGEHLSLDLLAGFRYLNLDESLEVNESSQTGSTSPSFPDARIAVADRFATSNDFYGGQLGSRVRWCHGRWNLDLTAKVALGTSDQGLDVRGATAIQAPGQPLQGTSSGLLALGSNSGHFDRNAFAVVPEVSLNIGYQFATWLRVYVGYSFLYWSQVARPGDQIDRALNVNQIPTSQSFGAAGGGSRPLPLLNSTDFWAHGVHFGLEFRF